MARGRASIALAAGCWFGPSLVQYQFLNTAPLTKFWIIAVLRKMAFRSCHSATTSIAYEGIARCGHEPQAYGGWMDGCIWLNSLNWEVACTIRPGWPPESTATWQSTGEAVACSFCWVADYM